ncbi:leucine zipper protein 2 isoform X2 [Prinia subflava]|uniref:leucine zipper protein 2 isoform X2 n=1 Tax=Prinia subflava TaxID=208062 RepID=UPI002FE18BC0
MERAGMRSIAACCLLPLLAALAGGSGQGYEELERQLKEVFKERSTILQELLKTSKELQGIKVNLQSLKNDEASTKNDVQKLLELGQNQREMKSLQEAFQKQLNEAAEKAEKQQATINFLKTEMERKSRIIRDLQNENKSLKNKLLSGNKLCGIHAEESKKIQAQLKELRYGKKDLIFKAQQLTDLEQKLSAAKDKLENAALDKSQLKALKETVQLCLSSVLRPQPPPVAPGSPDPAEERSAPGTKGSRAPLQGTGAKVWQNVSAEKENFHVALKKEENESTQECDSQDVAKTCLGNGDASLSGVKAAGAEGSSQKLHSPPWTKPEDKKSPEKKQKKYKESVSTQGKNL